MLLCENAKIPYQILPDSGITADVLSDYEMILLPEVYIIGEHLRSNLEEYVRRGGRVVSSVNSGRYGPDAKPLENFSIKALLGADFISLHEEYRQNNWGAYLTTVEGESFEGLLSCTTPPVSEFFAEVRTKKAKQLLRFVTPCVPCSDQQWVNWWSPPPGEISLMPALLENSFGHGTVFYCAFDLFTMAGAEQYNDTDNLFGSLLKRSGVNPLVFNETSTPGMLRTAFFQRENELIIHQLSLIPHLCRGETVPVSGGALIVDESRFKVKRVRVVYPAEQDLTVDRSRGKARISLPTTKLHQIICLEGNWNYLH